MITHAIVNIFILNGTRFEFNHSCQVKHTTRQIQLDEEGLQRLAFFASELMRVRTFVVLSPFNAN